MTNPRGAARFGRPKLAPRASGCDCPCHKNPAIKHVVACCGASAAPPSELNAQLQREEKTSANKVLEDMLADQIAAAGLPAPERQFKFLAPARDFRADFAWVEHLVLLEVDGGIYANGRHNRGTGIETDSEKQCLAAITGWRTLRVTATQIRDGRALEWISKCLS